MRRTWRRSLSNPSESLHRRRETLTLLSIVIRLDSQATRIKFHLIERHLGKRMNLLGGLDRIRRQVVRLQEDDELFPAIRVAREGTTVSARKGRMMS